ncbi:hypothetical protein [Gracilibacillus sp. YIM 98692]|uniref:hypothetical protein n=1 Tax=Gracilibacillus sp. YIM 98692 TaxID=2663532 RepID=UPI0013D12312|nr:hypothetical protein [Gracilibacillus sp. YIM 98692]
MLIQYTVGILILCVLTFYFLIFKEKERRPAMIGMVLPMAFGLCIGLLVGILFHDNLFWATLYSVVIISIMTTVSGLPLGYHVCLEGLFSGMMSAMMGAMLSVMLHVSESLFLLLLSVLLLVCMTILEIKRHLSQLLSHKQLAFGLCISILLITFLFFTFTKFIPEAPIIESPHPFHQ